MSFSDYVWQDGDEAALLADRAKGYGWSRCRPFGASADAKEGRWKALTGDRLPPAPKPKRGPRPDEDGLDRLRRGKDLSEAQLVDAQAYRGLGRVVELGGGGVKSCLDLTPGDKDRLPMGGGDPFEVTHAKRELFRIRYHVLKGQADLINVMDGVCIAGQTLIALAGGKDDRRAGQLLAVLKVALDLIRLDRAMTKSAAGKTAA